MNITNLTIGGDVIINEEFDHLFNADYRRFSYIEAASSMVEVTKDGKLLNWGVFNWK